MFDQLMTSNFIDEAQGRILQVKSPSKDATT